MAKKTGKNNEIMKIIQESMASAGYSYIDGIDPDLCKFHNNYYFYMPSKKSEQIDDYHIGLYILISSNAKKVSDPKKIKIGYFIGSKDLKNKTLIPCPKTISTKKYDLLEGRGAVLSAINEAIDNVYKVFLFVDKCKSLKISKQYCDDITRSLVFSYYCTMLGKINLKNMDIDELSKGLKFDKNNELLFWDYLKTVCDNFFNVSKETPVGISIGKSKARSYHCVRQSGRQRMRGFATLSMIIEEFILEASEQISVVKIDSFSF